MLRATLSKAMWVGRGAAAVFGLALVLALLLGVATMALAAVPGDPFRLGQTNGIDKISTLVGNVATPMLRIDNGSTAAGATALDLRVEAGKAPMKVNSGTRVADLNADRVDGKNASDFYAAGSTVDDSLHAAQADQADSATSAASATSAEDANTLDGKDSTEFLGKTEKAADADQLDGKDSSAFAAAYKRTVMVSPVGTDTENGQALLDAMDSIKDASPLKSYLLHIEPATYDLGTGSLSMKPFVDIEGSGERNTVITSGTTIVQSSGACLPLPGTVAGNFAEMRFLTVENTGAGTCSSAISNVGTPLRLTHVTAVITGESNSNTAVFNTNNASTTMTDVTADASGLPIEGTADYGVWSETNSRPTIRQSKLSGSTAALRQDGSSGFTPATVALSQLTGPVQVSNGGTVQCFNNYNQNLAAVAC